MKYTSLMTLVTLVSAACMFGTAWGGTSVDPQSAVLDRESHENFRVSDADDIPVVPVETELPAEPERLEITSENSSKASLTDDPVAEVLELRDRIRTRREEIEAGRTAHLKRTEEAYQSTLASIAPKDMFETKQEHRERDARERSEAVLERARSEGEIHGKYDTLLREDVEPLFERVRSLLSGTDVVPQSSVDARLESYDPEHGIFIGSLEVDSALLETRARIIAPMKRERAKEFWKNRDSLIAHLALSIDVYSLDVQIDDFWLQDPQSGRRTTVRVSVLETRRPSPSTPLKVVKPSEEKRKRAKALSAAAAALAKRTGRKGIKIGYTYKDWSKGVIEEYNHLIGEAKSVFARDPHIQGLKVLKYRNDYTQAKGEVTAAAKGLEAYLMSFLSSDAFKVSAAALAKRTRRKEIKIGYTYKDWSKGVIEEYNRLIGEAKSVFARDPHIQGLKVLKYRNDYTQAKGEVAAAAKGLELYLTSFVSSNAFKTSASDLAMRSAKGTKSTRKAKGWTAEYNRLAGEAKAVFPQDPHIRSLKTLSYGGSDSQAAAAVSTAASGLEAYLTSFLSSDAFKVSAAALAKRTGRKEIKIGYTYKDWSKGVIEEYNRLIGEAKSVFARDPHIQGLKILKYRNDYRQAKGEVTAAASGLEAYLTSFLSSDAFKVSAAALAKRTGRKEIKIGYTYKDWSKGVIEEYNRLIGEAKSVFAKDPHIQGLKILKYRNDYTQAKGEVTAAAKGLARAMGDVEEAPKELVTDAAAHARSPSYTPLDYLSYSSRFSDKARKLSQLLGREFSIDAKDENGWTDLHYAAALNLSGLASALLDAGAVPNARLKVDAELFSEELAGTLSYFGSEFREFHRHGYRPLHAAAWNDAELAVGNLLLAGAEIDAKSSTWHETPLHLAAMANSQRVAALLIGLGAEVNANDKGGSTPLDYAIYYEASATEAVLERHGGSCNTNCR